MSDIFKEVDEELRHERLVNLWKKWGPWVIGLAVAIVFAVGGYQLWSYLERQDRQADSAALRSAAAPIGDQNFEEAIKKLNELESQLDGNMRALARFREAEARLGTDDQTGAIAVLDSIAGDTDVSQRFRDLAALHAATLQLDNASFDEIEARVGPLARPENTWRFSAHELLGFAAMRADQSATARTHFETIASAGDAPAGIRRRARQMLDLIGPAEDGAAAESSKSSDNSGGMISTSGEESQ